MQRWEYKVVSLKAGQYTAKLNEHGLEGWELISVVTDVPEPPTTEPGGRLPMPRALGRLEEAAARLNSLGASDSQQTQAGTTALLWVLRRPLSEK